MRTRQSHAFLWQTVCLLAFAAAAQAQSFSYQGHLANAGHPANGMYDIRFRLMDAPAGGTQVGSTLTATNTPVSGGLFTASLDFGAGVFSVAGERWLEVAVRPSNDGDYTVLAPRQPVEATPRALTLEWPATGTAATSGPMLGLTNNSSGTVVDAVNGGTGIAVRAAVTNTASSTNALVATNAGSGRALFVQANGTGQAAFIRNSNTNNTQTPLNVTTNGNGTAAEFKVLDVDGTQPAVIVKHDGLGPALVCESSDVEAPALTINGGVRLVGDDVLFSVVGAAGDFGFIRLDHPLLNGNPSARLFVQPRTHATFNQARLVYPWYSPSEGQWRLKAYDGGINLEGFPFDVLVIQK